MKDKLSAFERRLEMLFLLNKCRETTALELSVPFCGKQRHHIQRY